MQKVQHVRCQKVQKVEIKLTRKSRGPNKTKWRPLLEGLEGENILIDAKLDRFNENKKYINQSTSN